MKRFIYILAFFIIFYGNLHAANHTVTITADSGAGSLRQAVTDAASGDTIIFDNSIDGQSITFGSEIALSSKDLIIDASGAGSIVFDGNSATRILNITNSSLAFNNIVFQNGSNTSDGGAIYASNTGQDINITNCHFLNNSSTENGGAIVFQGSGYNVNITSSSFVGNSTVTKGGALGGWPTATINIQNSTFYNNASTNLSGALHVEGSTYNIENSTFVNNRAPNGGINNQSGTISILNSAFYDDNVSYTIIEGAVTSQGYNFISNTTGATITPIPGDEFYTDATDPLLGTFTQDSDSITWAYPLISGSPLIDSGECTLSTDQFGTSRPQGGSCDKGAIEYVAPVNNTPTDINLSSTSINENAAAATVVGTLSTTDADADTHTYSLACSVAGTDDGSFSISGADLSINISPDYETQSSYDICIKTDDGNGGTYEENFTISVNDIFETGEVILESDFSNWTEATSIAGVPSFEHIVNGNGIFVAFVRNSSSIYHSTDLVNWNITSVSFNIKDMKFVNNHFIAVGASGNVTTSFDAVSWNEIQVASVSSKELRAVAYGNGLYLAATLSGELISSTDTVTWDLVTTTPANFNNFASGGVIMTYGNGKFILSGYQDYLYYSSDGINWTEVRVENAFWYGNDIKYLNNTFVIASGNKMVYSTDGINWTETNPGQATYSIEYFDGIWLAGTANETILTSTDLTTWTEQFTTPNTTYGWVTGISHDGYKIAFTSDGDGTNGGNIFYIVINPSVAPVVTSTPVTEAIEDDLYSYTLTATDDNNDTLIWSSVSIPSWLILSGSTLSGTPTASDVGEHNVSLRVTDGTFNVDHNFTVVVIGLIYGTVGNDTLLGTGGDDIFNPLAGDDAIDGQGGNDTIILSGNQADYMIVKNETGYLISGPDGNDMVTNIEYLDFDDNKNVAIETIAIDVISGLVAHYEFQGDSNDSTVNGYDLISDISDISFATGKFGQAADFGSGGIRVKTADNVITQSDSVTYSFWINTDATSLHILASYATPSAWSSDNALFSSSTEIGTGSSAVYSAQMNGTHLDGTWHHVVVTSDGVGNVQFYLDGISKGTVSATLTLEGTFYLGDFGSGTNYTGLMDDLRIYDRALTATDVNTLYNYIPLNTAPILTSIPSSEAIEDVEYIYHQTATDLDGDILTWSAVSVPSWLTLSDNNLTGTPTSSDNGEHNISITVTDGMATVDHNFTVFVYNNVAGTSGDDILNGTAGSDIFVSTAGNDIIDGLGGIDKLNLDGIQSSFTVSVDGGDTYVISNGTTINILVKNIELIDFSDNSNVAIDSLLTHNIVDSSGGLYSLIGTINNGSTLPATLVQIDSLTGELIRTIGDITDSSNSAIGYAINGMAYDHTTGILYASVPTNDPNAPDHLITIDPQTAKATVVGDSQVDSMSSGSAFLLPTVDSSGQMYGWVDPSLDDLVIVDKATGIATLVGDSSLSTFTHGLDFDENDNLFLVNSGGKVYTVNTTTGAATYIDDLYTTAHHGKFNPETGYYVGIDASGTGEKNLITLSLGTSSASVVGSSIPTVNDLHTLEFIPTSDFIHLPMAEFTITLDEYNTTTAAPMDMDEVYRVYTSNDSKGLEIIKIIPDINNSISYETKIKVLYDKVIDISSEVISANITNDIVTLPETSEFKSMEVKYVGNIDAATLSSIYNGIDVNDSFPAGSVGYKFYTKQLSNVCELSSNYNTTLYSSVTDYITEHSYDNGFNFIALNDYNNSKALMFENTNDLVEINLDDFNKTTIGRWSQTDGISCRGENGVETTVTSLLDFNITVDGYHDLSYAFVDGYIIPAHYRPSSETSMSYHLNATAAQHLASKFGLSGTPMIVKRLSSEWTYLSLPTNMTMCTAEYQSELTTICDQNYDINTTFANVDMVLKHTGEWSYWDTNKSVTYNMDSLASINHKEGLLVKSTNQTTLQLPFDIYNLTPDELMPMYKTGWFLGSTVYRYPIT
ncbi:MAG: LamG-like jellyroll fold domain-containing protein, partial [Campylobacterota bacterium]|nr:LamG-like jellyroll fold domain-containing protein [Campylobacterota bacterium]